MLPSRPFFVFVFLSLLTIIDSRANISPYTVHEKRERVPDGWSSLGRHQPSAVVPLRFGLTQLNINNVAEFLLDVSHPDSPNYGKHWTPGKIAATFAPSNHSVETVHDWLLEAGISADRIRLSSTRGWIQLNATVEEAERILLTEYHMYEHEDTGTKQIACHAYHVPEHVAPHIDIITPTIHFDAILTKRDNSTDPARNIGQPGAGSTPKTTGAIQQLLMELQDCDKQITPICLRALYGFLYEPLSPSRNSFGIVEYTPQAFLRSDLDMFFSNFSVSQVGQSPDVISIDGGVVQTAQRGFQFNGESNLDLQYGMTLVTRHQPVTLYQVGDVLEGASFNNFLDALDGSYCTFEGGDDPLNDGVYPDPLPGGFQGTEACGTVKPANVISTSYAYNEADLSPFYTARQCAEYAKLGLMGVTILYSSGDFGVAGNGGVCLNADGSQSPSGTIFNPSFPGTCPFITSVGATQVNPGATVRDPESACQQIIFSGGGFSNYFAIPDYQKNTVEKYLKDYPPPYPADIWNSTGVSRGYPDMSANGANYVIAVDGAYSLVYGTSASTPVVGALLTMVNDARITFGKNPIGFINPTIYSPSFQDAFQDITSGGNPGCGTSGFTAVPGWDPVTGLGTPNFPKLLIRWLLLP